MHKRIALAAVTPCSVASSDAMNILERQECALSGRTKAWLVRWKSR